MISLSREELKEILAEIFAERAKIDSEEHEADHRWIQEMIKAEHEKAEMYKEVRRIIMQYSLPLLLAGIFYWVQDWAQGHIK
jgi:hypothetical protein